MIKDRIGRITHRQWKITYWVLMVSMIVIGIPSLFVHPGLPLIVLGIYGLCVLPVICHLERLDDQVRWETEQMERML